MFRQILLSCAVLILTDGLMKSVVGDDLALLNEIMLNAHNELRSKEAKEGQATNMKKMVTNQALVDFAQMYASKCEIRHSSHQQRTSVPGFSQVGENLYYGPFQNAREPVDLWYDEVKYYNYSTHGCKPGQMCGHYTQVVWHDSDQLGCGYKKCGRYYWVSCAYGDGGNYRGVRPYKKGTICGDCKDKCEENLCSKSSNDGSSSTNTNEKGDCVDKKTTCQQWKADTEMCKSGSRYYTFGKANCRKTCKHCGVVLRDMYSKKICLDLKEYGLCRLSHFRLCDLTCKTGKREIPEWKPNGDITPPPRLP